MNIRQQYIAKSKYARYLDHKGRRENWQETVSRYVGFMVKKLQERGYEMPLEEITELYEGILKQEVMPSMRLLMTAGPAAERSNIAIYNCSFLRIDDQKSFDEAMYILLNGVGVGFSVEQEAVNKLPEVPVQLFESETTVVVADSKEGWAKALRQVIALLYSGEIPRWDLSKVRARGKRLKTFGGRASGPEVLDQLFRFLVKVFKGAVGRKLSSLECHDVVCKIAEVVVVGGTRRCFSGKVATPKGYVDVKDLLVGDEVSYQGKSYKILEKECTGDKPLLSLNLGLGDNHFTSLKCTKDHRVLVWSSMNETVWKEAGEVKPGDLLVWDLKPFSGLTEYVDLPRVKENLHFNSHTVKWPAYITEDLAWLIGLVHGDGSVQPRSVEISGNASDVGLLETASSIILDRFGLSSSIASERRSDNSWRLRVNSIELAEWFGLFKKSNDPLFVPECIKQSPKSVLCSYLAGLWDADGRCRTDGCVDQMTTVYANFADEIVYALKSLGIATKKLFTDASRRRAKGQKAQDHYTVRILGNTSRRTWMESVAPYCKSVKINSYKVSYKSPYDFSWPVSFIPGDFVGKSGWKKNSNMTHSYAAKAGLLNNETLAPVKVVSITEAGVNTTYDLEIEEVSCFVAEGVVVHNSALLSASDLHDDKMRHAKAGNWWDTNPERGLANNSAVYMTKPSVTEFMDEWKSLILSGSGERGIFNRKGAEQHALRWDRKLKPGSGLNPCAEILLNNYQFCNLSTVIVKPTDSKEDLLRKIRLAALLGTYQATLTDFKYLRPCWKKQTEEEALLGVSMTGILDHPLLRQVSEEAAAFLQQLRDEAVKVNKQYAQAFGINPAASVTAIKPEGSVSQLCNTASGIHPNYSEYYIRSYRQDNKDPLTDLMKAAGVKWEPADKREDTTTVFYFPVKAPEGAFTRDQMTAIEHLDLWLQYRRHFTQHNPSITVNVKPDEWLEVGAWVYKHFDEVVGVSFLPWHDEDHTYRQLPFQACTKEQYEELLAQTPESIDWDSLIEYDDNVEGVQTLACSSGYCEQ